ncbi:MAG: L,D-transpeptidase family protein [Caulobacteraceae bacterium]|nr:L,D-transpeptidase family protein [Caulobacter sp.]
MGIEVTGVSRRSVLAATLAAAPAFSAGRVLAEAPAARPFTSAEVALVRRTLADAPSHGIALSDVGGGAPEGDADLRRAILAYARAQHGGRIPEDKFEKNWGLRPAFYNAPKELAFALAQHRLDAWIASLPPPFESYRMLRDGMAVYRRLGRAHGWAPIPQGPDLAIGSTGPRVVLLRDRLAFEDVGVARASRRAPFDEPLAAAVRRVQARHGLAVTGVVSGRTLFALNTQPAERLRTMRANMERWRWAPRQWPADRVEVNIAAATFDLLDDNRRALSFLAAAGRPDDETPILRSTITDIVLNPEWNIPDSIAAKEMFPKEHKDPGYFEREGIAVRPWGGGKKLYQKPGPKNALGQIKFNFDNPYAVYLHDTPARTAFDHASRSVSHGCVRLEKPRELAVRLLAPNGDEPADRIDAQIASAETVKIDLKQPEPVFLLYWTAFPEGDQLAFRDDVYGWDAAVLRLLDAGAKS